MYLGSILQILGIVFILLGLYFSYQDKTPTIFSFLKVIKNEDFFEDKKQRYTPSDVVSLRHTFRDEISPLPPHQGKGYFKTEVSIEEKKKFANDLYNALASEISNPFLIDNKEIYNEWESLMRSASLAKDLLGNDAVLYAGTKKKAVSVDEQLNYFIDEYYVRFFKILKLLKQTEVYIDFDVKN